MKQIIRHSARLRNSGGLRRRPTIAFNLDICRDDFVGHPASPETLILVPPPQPEFGQSYGDRAYRALRLCRRHGFRVLSHGWAAPGYALTFASRQDAMLFRLFYIDGRLAVHDG